ncbi:MAG: peptidylprolyl isomerase [SAR324 cluster bacterium]|nr:peptidylprolyl isomerase [SAR324 cluster bacterium]
MKKLLVLICLLLPQALPAEEQVFDRVIVSVNNFAVTKQQIDMRLATIAASKGVKLNDPKIKEQLYKQTLTDLEEEALIESRGAELNISIPEEMLEDQLDGFLAQKRLTRLGFEMLLEERGENVSDYKNNLRKKLVRDQTLMREVQTQVIISDNKLKALFMKEGQRILKAHARHILVLVKQTASLKEVERARAKLVSIKQKIDRGGSFSKLAVQNSDDPSVKFNNGDLGFFAKGKMVPAFSKAAFSLPLRKLSDPVRTSYGFHLIEVLERKEFESDSFDKVKSQFSQEATQKLYEEKYKEFIAKLRSDAYITYH